MNDLKTLKKMICQLFEILSRKQRFQALGVVLMLFLGSFFELLGVSAMLPFINAILEPEKILNNRLIGWALDFLGIKDQRNSVLLIGLAIIIIYICKNLYLILLSYVQIRFGNSVRKSISVSIFRAYLSQDYVYFTLHGSGEIMRGVLNDVNGAYSALLNGFHLASEILVVIVVTIYLLITDFFMAAGVVVVGAITMLTIVIGLKKPLSSMALLNRKSVAELNKNVIQTISGIKEIIVFKRRNVFLNKFKESYFVFNSTDAKYSFISTLPERVIEGLCVSGIIGTVLLKLSSGVSAEEFVPKLAVFAVGAFRLMPSISRATGYINALVYNRAMLDATYSNVKNRLRADNSQLLSDDGNKKEKNDFSIVRLSDIHWTYPETTDETIQGLDLEIHKGDCIGIVGESGSGKSTFSEILLGLLKPQEGSIIADEMNVLMQYDTWLDMIGYVPQSVFLMDDTIRENIIFGSSERDDNKVWKVIEQAALMDFVKELPNGLDTMVGERGTRLSGGQCQRLAIARALYHGPQILVLDEATSALDLETEEEIMKSIDALVGDITLVIVAHRLTTLRKCNKIYEIKNGKAVERNNV